MQFCPGYEGCDGRFEVEDYLFYEGGPQKPLSRLSNSPLLVIISGLNWSVESDFATSLELFQQWIFGNLEGLEGSDDWEAASVVRVVIAGNSISSTGRDKNLLFNTTDTFDYSSTLAAAQKLDNFLSDLAKSVCVDLMPGEFDPANFMLPQQPLHPCMFPKSIRYKSFQSVPNPYAFEIDGRNVLATSGQNVHDIQRYSNIEDPVEALKSSLIWSHIYPTA